MVSSVRVDHLLACLSTSRSLRPLPLSAVSLNQFNSLRNYLVSATSTSSFLNSLGFHKPMFPYFSSCSTRVQTHGTYREAQENLIAQSWEIYSDMALYILYAAKAWETWKEHDVTVTVQSTPAQPDLRSDSGEPPHRELRGRFPEGKKASR